MSYSVASKFILAYWMIKASVESDMGRALLDILKSQYSDPEDPITAGPFEVGEKMIAVARRELQNDTSAAQDAVQDFLAYIIEAKTDFRGSKKKGPGSGAKTWRQALKNAYSNIRTRAMAQSFKRFKKVEISDEEAYAHLLWKQLEVKSKNPHRGGRSLEWTSEDSVALKNLAEKLKADGIDPNTISPAESKRKGARLKTIDEAFGARPEGGGASEGGEGKLPQGSDTWLGKALDDQAHAKSFFTALQSVIPKMRSSLPEDQRILFDVVFEDEEGGFGSNIDENMNQSKAYIDRLVKEGKSDLAARIKKRPGLMTEIRAKLLSSIQKFIKTGLTAEEYQVLEDEFLSDVSFDALERTELKKLSDKYKHWRGIDMRKRKKMLDEMKEGKDVDYDSLDKLQSRLELQEEFGRLEYVMSRRRLMKEESVRYNDMLSEMKKREINYQAIPPIEHDLGQIDLLSKLKWLEKEKKLTPEQDSLMDDTWDSLLTDFPANIVESIVPVKPKNGEKVATSIVRIAVRIARSLRSWVRGD